MFEFLLDVYATLKINKSLRQPWKTPELQKTISIKNKFLKKRFKTKELYKKWNPETIQKSALLKKVNSSTLPIFFQENGEKYGKEQRK